MLTIDEHGHVVVDHNAKQEKIEDNNDGRYEITSDIPLVPVGDKYEEGAEIKVPSYLLLPGSEVNIPVTVRSHYEIDNLQVVYNTPDHPIKDLEDIEFELVNKDSPRPYIRFTMPKANVHIVISVKRKNK